MLIAVIITKLDDIPLVLMTNRYDTSIWMHLQTMGDGWETPEESIVQLIDNELRGAILSAQYIDDFEKADGSYARYYFFEVKLPKPLAKRLRAGRVSDIMCFTLAEAQRVLQTDSDRLALAQGIKLWYQLR